jgi:TolA-binding protein
MRNEALRIIVTAFGVSWATHAAFAAMRPEPQAAPTSAASQRTRDEPRGWRAPEITSSAAAATGTGRNTTPRIPQPGAPPEAMKPERSPRPASPQGGVAATRATASAADALGSEIASLEQRIAELSGLASDPEAVQAREDNRVRRQWLRQGQQKARELYDASRRDLGAVEFARLEQAYEEGLELEHEGKHDAVIERMTAVAQAAPDSALAPSALVVKAYAQRRSGDAQGALRTAEQVIAAGPEARSLDGQLQAARGFVLKAEACRDLGDMACVRDAREQLAGAHPDAVLPSGSLAVEYVDGLF